MDVYEYRYMSMNIHILYTSIYEPSNLQGVYMYVYEYTYMSMNIHICIHKYISQANYKGCHR